MTSAPIAAPATVPRLNDAWNRGITERPISRSTSAPSTFIDTSQVPVPNPTRNSPAAVTGTDSNSPTLTATVIRPTASTSDPAITTRRAPKRCTEPPVDGSATTAPIEAASRSSPSLAGLRSRACRTDGIREAQVAKAKPLRKKVASTALRAVTTSRVTVPVERLTRGAYSLDPARRKPDPGAGMTGFGP